MLVSRYQQPMLRLACSMVANQEVAEEAVQTRGWGWFAGSKSSRGARRSKRGCPDPRQPSGRSAGSREHPNAPIEALHAVDPIRFDAQGQWADPLERWAEESEDRLDAVTWLPILKSALDDLPPRQREIVILRDVEGLSNDEACAVLGISSGNQRILLHRGRSRLREMLEVEREKN